MNWLKPSKEGPVSESPFYFTNISSSHKHVCTFKTNILSLGICYQADETQGKYWSRLFTALKCTTAVHFFCTLDLWCSLSRNIVYTLFICVICSIVNQWELHLFDKVVTRFPAICLFKDSGGKLLSCVQKSFYLFKVHWLTTQLVCPL